MSLKHHIAYLVIICCLLIGILMYCISGREVLLISQLSNDILNFQAEEGVIPWFLQGSLPDGLWMMALCLMIIAIWDFKWTFDSILWYTLTIIAGYGFEFLQYTYLVPGTFDWLDVIALSIGAIIPLLFIDKRERYESNN